MPTTGAFTDYLENALINHILRNTAYTTPGLNVWVGLFTADPTDTGSLASEVSGNNYGRVQATFSAPSNGVTSNSGALTFPTASGSWSTVSWFGIMDAQTSGNMLFRGQLDVAKAVAINDTVKFNAGDLQVTLD